MKEWTKQADDQAQTSPYIGSSDVDRRGLVRRGSVVWPQTLNWDSDLSHHSYSIGAQDLELRSFCLRAEKTVLAHAFVLRLWYI